MPLQTNVGVQELAQDSNPSYKHERSALVRAVMSLLGGGAVAQLIPYLATVFLARLFSPAQYGYLALFTSITVAIAMVSTGRYEFAVLLPEKERDALALVLLVVILAFGFSCVVGVICWLLTHTLVSFPGGPFFLWALPVVVFSIALYQVLCQWFLRQGLYRYISGARIIQAVFTVFMSALLGWLGFHNGLIAGYALGWLASAVCLIAMTLVSRKLYCRPSIELIKKNAVLFSDHAIYGAIPALLNSLSLFVLIFIINHHYGSNFAGQYGLSMQVAYGPISLVVGAIGQVIFRESSQLLLHRESDKAFFLMIARYLTYSAAAYVLILMAFSPTLFPIFFGASWQFSGKIAAILAIGYGIRLVSSTLSNFLLAHNALRINGVWQSTYFISICLLYYVKPVDPLLFFIGLSCVDVILYVAYFVIIRQVVYTHSITSLGEIQG